ncbi:MAG: hypothetical protein RLZZ399_2128 [Verrucomicrobiota bacterium]|jgi:S1-C subfamily serine protease
MRPELSLWCLWTVLLPASLSSAAPLASGGKPLEIMRAMESVACDVFEKAAPAVVVVEVDLRPEGIEPDTEAGAENGTRRNPAPQAAPAEPRVGVTPMRSEGSGFLVRENGVILTNHHVVTLASRITVRLRDGRRFPARLLGADERTDVAVLKIEAAGLPVLNFADSDRVRVGQWVCAIGAPFSQEWSFTSGMLSGKGRTRLLGPGSPIPLYENYLQTDAFISPGHSGGPLLDLEGEVLGMNTLITRVERGLAFAVPSRFLQQTLTQILAAGRVSRPWLGIRIETLGDSPELQERLAAAGPGAVILAIEPDGPSFKTDLRPADVIQAVDGVPIRSAMDLQQEVFGKKVGQPVTLEVWRPGGRRTLRIPTVEMPEAVAKPGSPNVLPPLRDFSHERFGLALREIRARGVRVDAVEAGSLAARAELAVGDIITDVEGRAVRSSVDCLNAIRAALSKESGGGAILQIERQGRRTFVLLKGR